MMIIMITSFINPSKEEIASYVVQIHIKLLFRIKNDSKITKEWLAKNHLQITEIHG